MGSDPFWTALETEPGDTFRLEATSRDNGIEGEALDRFVDQEDEEIIIPYRGPSDRVYSIYTLTLDIGAQETYHAHGPPGDQSARGSVTDFELIDD